MYLYSTLNPVELREFRHNKIVKDTFNRVHNFKKALGKIAITDKFDEYYTKSTRDENTKSSAFHKIIYLLVFFFLLDRLVKNNFHKNI